MLENDGASLVVTITGSPVVRSRTAQIGERVATSLAGDGFEVQGIEVRDLAPEDLIHARCDSPALRDALGLVERARGVVIVTPIYKASYSGVLKAFLDLLPQSGLAGKVVLPIAIGGSIAHLLAIDYALRPVLLALGAQHVVSGLFVLETSVERLPGGGICLDPNMAGRLDQVVSEFAASVDRRGVQRRSTARRL